MEGKGRIVPTNGNDNKMCISNSREQQTHSCKHTHSPVRGRVHTRRRNPTPLFLVGQDSEVFCLWLISAAHGEGAPHSVVYGTPAWTSTPPQQTSHEALAWEGYCPPHSLKLIKTASPRFTLPQSLSTWAAQTFEPHLEVGGEVA